MKVLFTLEAPPQYAELFEQAVGECIAFEHHLSRINTTDLEVDYAFEAEHPRAFVQVGILVAQIYVVMEKREVAV